MPDRIETKSIDLVGGLVTSMGSLEQATQAPGSAVRLVNFEPAVEGGYRRIDGYQKYHADPVPGSGSIIGVAVFNGGVIACREDGIYFGTPGAGWSQINSGTPHTGAKLYRFARYNFTGVEKIAFCDGQNRPASYDGTSYAQLSNAPDGAEHIAAFARRLWFAKDNILTFGAVTEDNDFTPASGAGEINVGDTITGLLPWRDQLIVFAQNRIIRITGDSASNFSVQPITDRMGCTQSHTITEIAGDIVFWADDGLRTIGGTDRVGDFDLSSISRVISDVLRELKASFPRLVAVPVRSKTQLRIYGYSATVPDHASRGVVVTLRSGDPTVVNLQEGGGWEWAELSGVKVHVADSFYADDGSETIVFGNDSGYVYVLNSGTSFDGNNIMAVFQTPHLVFNDPNIRKVFRRLRVYLYTDGNYTIQVALKLDHELPHVLQPPSDVITRGGGVIAQYDHPDSKYGHVTYAGTSEPYSEIPLVGTGFSGSFVFVSNDTSHPYVLSSLSVEVSHEGRK